MSKKVGLTVLICVLLISLFCVPSSLAASKDVTLAYITPSIAIPFWKWLGDGILEEANKMGVEVVIYDSHNDSRTQLRNTEDAITRGIDGIIISPTDSAACVSVLNAAKAAGVPVVIDDIGTLAGEYVSFVISDNYEGARKACELLVQKMTEKGWAHEPVSVVTIPLARLNGQLRTKGFSDVMRENDFPVVSISSVVADIRREGIKFVEDQLTAHPDLRGIFLETDELVQAAVTAIKEAGKLDDIVIAGFDGSETTYKYIKDGIVVGQSMQQPVEMGRQGFKAMWKYLQGEDPAKEILVPVILVTTENAEEVKSDLEKNVWPAN